MLLAANPRVINKFPAGVVNIPPSKSQAHRAIICALLSCGGSRIENVELSRDIAATLRAVEALGASWKRVGHTVEITGTWGAFPNGAAEPILINCGESGSTLRFLLPVAAALGVSATFVGEGRLMRRPLEPYEQVFAQNGAALQLSPDGVKISGKLAAGTYRLDGKVSSQFVSGLLLALPLLDGDSTIVIENELESRAYVDMTIDTCAKFSVSLKRDSYREFYIKGGQAYYPARIRVEGDYSQAAYFLAAGALGADVACAGLPPDSLQGDREILNILRRMGAEITQTAGGVLKARVGRLCAVDIDVSQIPDLAPPVAALMCLADGKSSIYGAARLRLKESDRLRAIAQTLGALGAGIIEVSGGLTIQGKPSLCGGQVGSHNDHRIAMMVAVAAVRCEGEVTLTGWQCVDKSYPGYWYDWEAVGR
ncbi:MAG: 3-phosphoshikimate 1-carboxyvinyltransferase [Defluviitaleaceae bacterium]|nr:3-phosphoshikimate 1-carboxyvinyltransferase [Defluviitaleaceae bacterium]